MIRYCVLVAATILGSLALAAYGQTNSPTTKPATTTTTKAAPDDTVEWDHPIPPRHDNLKPQKPIPPRQALKEKLPKLDLDDVEFQAALQFIRDLANVNIDVNWKALTVAGIDEKKTKINLHLQGVTVEEALRAMLRQAGGSVALGFNVHEGAITISTVKDLIYYTVVNGYSVRDILDVDHLSLLDRSLASTDLEACTIAAERLERLLKKSIDPDSWKPEGTVGSLGFLEDDFLVILQTPETQEQIHAMLSALVPDWAPAMRERLHQPVKNVSLRNLSWQDAIRAVHKGTGINIVVDPAVLGGKLAKVDLLTADLTAQQAISLLAKSAGAKWYVVDGAVYIQPPRVPPPKPQTETKPQPDTGTAATKPATAS